jgi:hypothetical protein
MASVGSRSRAKVTAYTSALIIAVASSVYLAVVPFLPAPPIVPLLVGVGLGALSLRNRGVSIAALYLLVYFSVLWQMIGFGFFQLLSSGVGVAVLLALAVPLIPFMTKRVELSSMALAILAVALMLTPAYFVSIPLVAAAALTFGGFATLEAMAATYIFLLAPFLLLENAIYFTTNSGATTPIIFGQLTILAQNLRPPLPGLNFLLTGLPANYLSHSALPVSTWLSSSSGVLLIPMVVLGVVLFVATSIGGLARTFTERFERSREMAGRVKLVLAPLVVAVVTPTIFIVLLTLLSRPGSGGFQTSLTNDPSHLQAIYMLGSSFLLTTTFIGRESLILRLEGVQVGTEDLEELMNTCLAKMKGAQELLDKVSTWVPSMSLSGERRSMSEYSAYLENVRRQMGGASGAMIAQFQTQLEASVLRPLAELPELLRKRVASELRGLVLATATANNHLEEASVPVRYPDIPAVPDLAPLKDLVQAYEVATAAIRGVTEELSASYGKESASLGLLMGQQEEVNPPVSASALLQSNEFIGAMRLVAEEYWLNFHLRWAEQLDKKKSALLAKTKDLDYAVGEAGLQQRLHAVEKVVAEAKPANSSATLESLRDLRSILETIVTQAASGAGKVGAMLESLELKSTPGLRFETVNRLGEVLALKKQFASVGVSFDSLTGFLESAAGVLRGQADAWKSDRDNLVVLGQYPLAKKIIGKMLSGQKRLALAQLPYHKRVAALYAQLYAAGSAEVEYDEDGESLMVKGEHA